MPRTLRPGQRSQLFVLDVSTGVSTLMVDSTDLLFEAPNWTPDGRWLILNGGGHLFRTPAAPPAESSELRGASALEQIDLAGVPEINNDHVLSPDGATVYVSAEDGHIYAVPIEGGSHRRVSNDRGPGFRYYLHGVSPDGETLAYIGLERDHDGAVTTNVFTIPAAGGKDTQLTFGEYPHDGCEYSPDGRWIYFNSERPGLDDEGDPLPDRAPGHAQLFRMPVGGGAVQQLTFDDRVNWFPHVSPDGRSLAYISFPAGTRGHPADLDVTLRLLPVPADDAPARVLDDVSPRDLVQLFGGQGTINVPSWDPTGLSDATERLAYVAYPIDDAPSVEEGPRFGV